MRAFVFRWLELVHKRSKHRLVNDVVFDRILAVAFAYALQQGIMRGGKIHKFACCAQFFHKSAIFITCCFLPKPIVKNDGFAVPQ